MPTRPALSVPDSKRIERPAHAIVETAKFANVDMIFLGSRGLGDMRGLMMGSVSHKVMPLAPVSRSSDLALSPAGADDARSPTASGCFTLRPKASNLSMR